MSFEDELKELISNAQAHKEGQNQQVSDFLTHWHKTKMEIVKPAMDTAAKVLRIDHFRLDGRSELRNSSIHLEVGPKQSNSVTNELIFSPNKEKLVIDCTYKNADKESFTLDSLDRLTVERKIKEFLSAVLG
jgi:hypothetical protein